MRKLPVAKLLTSFMVLLLIVLSFVPAVAEAKFGDEDELNEPTAVTHFQEGEGEGESEAETGGVEGGSLAGTGIALGIVALILVLLAVVAVIGAASLGIIGLGYWQSESSD